MSSPPAPIARGALYELVWSRPMRVVAAEFGVTNNGLSKICDRLLIPYPSRGHWAKVQAGRAPVRPPLPAAPELDKEPIVISGERARSRRPRTRFSLEARREQLIVAGAEMIAAEGLPGMTMKSVARRVGISEAQAHNYFSQRKDLLVAIARRELEAMEAHRRNEIGRGHDRYTRVTLSTITYLREVAERGALIQILTQSSEVRAALRAERHQRRRWDAERVSAELQGRYSLPANVAYAGTTVLSSLSRRAGRLLAAKKLPLEAAERLTIALITAGNRELVRPYRAARAAPEALPKSPPPSA